MTCPIQNKQDEQILVEYCAGTLEARRAGEIESHITECRGCAKWIAGQRAVWGTLDEWAAPEIAPDFNARLYQRIEQEQRGGWWTQLWRTAWKPALVTAGVGAALVIGLSVNGPQSNNIPTKASADNVDIDQVEHALEDLDLLTPGGGGSRL